MRLDNPIDGTPNRLTDVAAFSIAFVANHATMGGGEVMLLRLAECAHRHGMRVTVLGPSRPDDLASETVRSEIPYLGVGAGPRPRLIPAMARALARWEADLVWSGGLWPGVAAALGHRPHVLHLHQAPKTAHQPIARAVRSRATSTVVPSAFMATRIHGSRALQNWTEDLKGLSRRVPCERLRVGFAGRLSTIKGVDTLAMAVSSLQDRGCPVGLVLAGDDRFVPGRLGSAVAEALATCTAPVTSLGWVPIQQFHEAVDVVVVPSRWEEPFGLVAAEAMSAGLPVVVSDAGALPEVVGPDHPWVFRREDAADLAAVLHRLWSSPEATEQSVLAARRRWEERFSPHAGEARFLRLLDDLL
jgi:glycosyltransferase involved in cell wall biosynthesis